MKRLFLFITFSVLSGCLSDGSNTTSKLELNVDEVNFCTRPYGDSFVWNDLQLRNTGKGPLNIKSIAIRGDAGCAFECSYNTGKGITNCPRESAASSRAPFSVAEGDSLLVRVTYTPGEEEDEDASDLATLIITTDADNVTNEETNWSVVKVPMCGWGIALPDTDGDAGILDIDAGSGGCESCGKPLKKGAPSCSNS